MEIVRRHYAAYPDDILHQVPASRDIYAQFT
jgi:hypothetical protein